VLGNSELYWIVLVAEAVPRLPIPITLNAVVPAIETNSFSNWLSVYNLKLYPDRVVSDKLNTKSFPLIDLISGFISPICWERPPVPIPVLTTVGGFDTLSLYVSDNWILSPLTL
jgi:hypothetical protein